MHPLGRAIGSTVKRSVARRLRTVTSMAMVKSVLHWMGAKFRHFRDLFSGDDLHEAQMNRGDDHEFKVNPGGPVGGGGGG